MTLLAEHTSYVQAFAPAPVPRFAVRRKAAKPLSAAPKRTANASLAFALKQLPDVHGASVQSLQRLRNVLSLLLEDRMAYATLSSDGDGGAMAQWRAGRSYIALEIGVDECSFVYSDANGNLRENLTGADALRVTVLRTALRNFTADLDEANPSWRAQREAHAR